MHVQKLFKPFLNLEWFIEVLRNEKEKVQILGDLFDFEESIYMQNIATIHA